MVTEPSQERSHGADVVLGVVAVLDDVVEVGFNALQVFHHRVDDFHEPSRRLASSHRHTQLLKQSRKCCKSREGGGVIRASGGTAGLLVAFACLPER